MATSLGLGRQHPPVLGAYVPYRNLFAALPTASVGNTAQDLATDFYFGGWPPPPVQIPYSWLRPPVRIRQDTPLNVAEVTKSRGDTARATNSASVSGNQREWRFAATVDSIQSADAQSLADWVIAYYDTSRPRLFRLSLHLGRRTEAEVARIVGVTVGRRISITGPPGTPAVLNANPWMETGVTEWTATGGTRAQSTVWSRGGSNSLALTPSGVSVNAFVSAEAVPVVAGYSYDVEGYLFSPGGWGSVGVNVNWLDSAQAYLSTTGSSSSIGAGATLHVAEAHTAPAGAAYGRVHMVAGGTPAASDVLYGDSITITGSSTALIWPTGATEQIVEGITHTRTADRAIVEWITSPLIGAAVGQAGPWFRLGESPLGSPTDVLPY